MLAANVLAALLAVAAVDVELADDRPARNLGLELLVEMVLDDVAAAIGTLIGQGRVVGFIDQVRRRRVAMRVPAMLVAHLAAWLFGVLLGLAFGKRGRLPLGRAFGFFEAFLEIVNGLLELRDLLAKLLIFEEQLLVRSAFHADLDNDKPCQLSGIIVVFAVIGKWSLNKHD